ncbi:MULTISPECIES: DUF2514 domain-containing protein [Pseudomonas syringae group]|uniref:DUF2514 domain-containing protein n=2 Tax=Pseudomonas syringae group TaxID=136849 RepID=A0A3M5G2Q5_PSESS|nr:MULTISPECIES: DUF2514 domain-containing protein [Pseudomonas syringae group]PPS32650.1 hypothetical protein BVY12_17920 [Pseudomonas amygdali pv. morsprunorum]KPW95727.1 hypothetical protein ALO79_200389 [Pseudomonas syringae pv. castaneae]KWS93107.1 hypothetical protein AL048_26530 [Pseudomonas syringae pv. castaneae]RMS80707.1 hypothetical protein ALP59_01523 [Pseudomonas savastanoi]RMS82260.1 hypothetical protein ALP58_02822 [Pseudomonas savastanoi]
MKALPWKAVGLLLVLLALAGALYGAYLHGVNVTDLAWKAKWAEEASTQSEAVASKTTEYRTEEQRRQKAANQVANDARQEQTAALTDAAVADAAGERLRVEAGKLAAASCAPVDTGAAQRGKAANRAAMVLSELLSRSDARAGELAKYADSARITGLACNRFVDELTSTTNSARP